MTRYESFAPAELGHMFLMLHRSEKRLRVIEEADTERLGKIKIPIALLTSKITL